MWQELRVAQIKALRGKYRHALTPSDDFARQKQEEIALERAKCHDGYVGRLCRYCLLARRGGRGK
jgi:hypothetical protein